MAEDKSEIGPPKGKGPPKGADKSVGRTGRPNWSQRTRPGSSPLGNTPIARPQVPGDSEPRASGQEDASSGGRGVGGGGDSEASSQGRNTSRGGGSSRFGHSAKGLARAGMRGARGRGTQGRAGSMKDSIKEEAKSHAKRAVKKAAVKTATGAASAATGIPQPVIEQAVKHWRALLAAILIIPPLLIFSIFLVISGSLSGSNLSSAACTSAASAATSAVVVTPGTPPPASQLSLFMAAERWMESRNNYADASAGAIWEPNYTGGVLDASGAFGAYQYIQSTWYSYASSAGAAAYEGDDPATLPASISSTVQDKVASWEFTRDYKQDSGNPADTGNIWLWVAEQHFDSSYALPGTDQNFAPGNNGGETMADYGNSVVGYMTSEPWLTSASGTTTTNADLAGYSGSCDATEVSGPLASQIVEIAQSNLGLTQVAGNFAYGSNAWGEDGLNWCAFFASWVLDRAGVTPPPGSVGLVSTLETDLVNEGGTQLSPSSTPAPGDLVFFGTPSDGLHVAIITQVLPDGDIAVVGGNEGTNDATTSSVNQSTPFAPAMAVQEGWPGPIWAYVQPAGG